MPENAVPLLIVAVVAAMFAIYGYARVPAEARWSRLRFSIVTTLSVTLALWPLALPAIFHGIIAAIWPGLFIPIALGGVIGFLAGKAMPIADFGMSNGVRIHTNSPIMELILGAPAAGPVLGSFLRANPSVAIIADYGGLALSTTALAAVYVALNWNLRRNPDREFFDRREAGAAPGEYRLVLTHVGDYKLRVIKALRDAKNMSLGHLVPMLRVPHVILDGVDEVEAAKVKADLEAAGASVEIVKTQAHSSMEVTC